MSHDFDLPGIEGPSAIVQTESNRVLKTGKRDMELVNQNKE